MNLLQMENNQKRPRHTLSFSVVQEFQSWTNKKVNQKMTKHHFTAMSKMMILHNMAKKNNISERNKMDTHQMVIVKNYDSNKNINK